MRKALVAIGTLLLAILLILVACTFTFTPEDTAVPEAEPAEFEVTSLAVTPIVVEPGQAVTIEVEVKNVGGTEGSHTLVLTVNGVEEETKDVTVKPFVTETAAFTLLRDTSGMYDIEVSGLSETLRVKQAGAYPRLGNFWGIGGFPTGESARLLAKWDLVIVSNGSRLPAYAPYVRLMKELNPNVKVLAFVSAGYRNPQWWGWMEWRPLVRESWYLHHPGTGPLEERRVVMDTSDYYEDTVTWFGINPATEWSTYLPNWVYDEVMSTGLFDGVFYDCVFDDIWWVSNIDIDNDGVAESPAVVKREYQKGMTELLKLTRELLGPEAIIICNPGSEWSANSPYFDYANGHMQENALGTHVGTSWPKVWEVYQANMQKQPPPPRMHWIAVDTDMNDFGNVDAPDFLPWALQRMRFGLAITLLGDGYFGFDLGYAGHCQLWWFPEYDANLGLAMGDAQERSDGSWMREFENGVVVANSTSKESTVEFAAIYRDVTTGVEGTSFAVPALDGRIFVKVD
jgi:hypothetical protein